MTLEQITEMLSQLEDALEQRMEESREKEQALIKLAETIFWITYYEENQGE